jgi:hypothetical protein
VGPLSEEPRGALAPELAQIGLAHNGWNKFGKEPSALVETPECADRTQIHTEDCFIPGGYVYKLVIQTRLFFRVIAWTRSDFGIETHWQTLRQMFIFYTTTTTGNNGGATFGRRA